MTKKKTIFLTIERGLIVRNLLHNDFYRRLKDNYHIVIFSPLYRDKQFRELFSGEDVDFEELYLIEGKRLMKLFTSIHKSLIYNPTIKLKAKYGFTEKSKQVRNLSKITKNTLEYIVFGLFLSKIKWLRTIMKKLDTRLFQCDLYDEVIKKYQPVAIFISNVSSNWEVFFLRNAKKFNIYSLGMTKSWDNFSKIGMREPVDKLIVWSDYMKDEALEFQNYKEKDIAVVGIPQFDLYYNIKDKYTKADFTRIYGLDANKKIILFGQEAPHVSPDDPYVVSVLRRWIEKENKDYQILIRPHFAHKRCIEAFASIADNKTVFIDILNNPSVFKDEWDISSEHHLRLALSMRFSDLVVTSVSTLVLDAIASGNWVMCYSFDKDKSALYKDSIKRLYETLWFRDLKNYGLDKFMVDNEEEMFKMIEDLLVRPRVEAKEEYKEIINRFCYLLDGQSGQRLYNYFNEQVNLFS